MGGGGWQAGGGGGTSRLRASLVVLVSINRGGVAPRSGQAHLFDCLPKKGCLKSRDRPSKRWANHLGEAKMGHHMKVLHLWEYLLRVVDNSEVKGQVTVLSFFCFRRSPKYGDCGADKQRARSTKSTTT